LKTTDRKAADPLPFAIAPSQDGRSATLEFADARSLRAIHAGDDTLLRRMETALGIRITSRDGWMRLEGEAAAMTAALGILTQLGRIIASGAEISRDGFLFALGHPTEAHKESSASPVEELYGEKVQCSSRKPAVVPKTMSQRDYLRAIDAHDITFGIGPAGTGKTYLAVAKAVSALKSEKVSRIILTRPAVEAGEALGFLPGELEEKILPYLRPLYDALHDMLEPDEIQRAIERGVIEIAPLAYMRGRTLNKAFIILDEAQNTTAEQMFMFLTRIGMGSKCVITGDRTQIDLPKNKLSGLIEASSALSATPGIAFHYFGDRDVVRHPLIQAIVAAYKEHRGAGETRL
jgi:phosphate starvation-inducible PhoH-like protein